MQPPTVLWARPDRGASKVDFDRIDSDTDWAERAVGRNAVDRVEIGGPAARARPNQGAGSSAFPLRMAELRSLVRHGEQRRITVNVDKHMPQVESEDALRRLAAMADTWLCFIWHNRDQVDMFRSNRSFTCDCMLSGHLCLIIMAGELGEICTEERAQMDESRACSVCAPMWDFKCGFSFCAGFRLECCCVTGESATCDCRMLDVHMRNVCMECELHGTSSISACRILAGHMRKLCMECDLHVTSGISGGSFLEWSDATCYFRMLAGHMRIACMERDRKVSCGFSAGFLLEGCRFSVESANCDFSHMCKKRVLPDTLSARPARLRLNVG
eukprot:2462583-Amphidinium_carterae.1